MSRRLPTIEDLASEAGMEIEAALLLLIDAELTYLRPEAVVFRRHLAAVRETLHLPPDSVRHDPTLITNLARRAGHSEEKTRSILVAAGVLRKSGLKRIPSALLRKAELALGLRIPSDTPIESSTPATPTGTTESGRRSLKVPKAPSRSWPTIGPPQTLEYLRPDHVEGIHWALVKDFASSKDPIVPAGIRDQSLLESAVHRPRTALGPNDKYPTVAMASAALLHAIILDHPFHNGNKRTAIVSTLVFLDMNGWVLTCDEDAIYKCLLALADHKICGKRGVVVNGSDSETLCLADWIQNNIRRVDRVEHPLKFREFRSILETYGCSITIAPGVGNRVNIRKGSLHVQVAYRNEGSDVEKNTIHSVRKELELDEPHGYDSDIFYQSVPRIPEFINKYRKLLGRLAKV